MSGAEAIAAIQSIDACIGIAKTIINIGRAVHDAHGLPPKLQDLLKQLPAIEELLESAYETFQDGNVSKDTSKSAQAVLKQCEHAISKLRDIFRKACPKDDDSCSARIWKGTKTVFFGRDSQVQRLLVSIQDNMKILEQMKIYIIGDRLDKLQELTQALGNEDGGKYEHSGTGHIFANQGGSHTTFFGGSGNGRRISDPGTYCEGPSTHIYNHSPIAMRWKETPPGPSSNIPFPRDPDFIERTALTKAINAKMASSAGRIAIVGLGGVGKSQLAIEYGYRYRDEHPDRWVLWIHASSTARFDQSVRDIAALVQVPRRTDAQANIYQLLRAWLFDRRNGHWLVILDNADDASFLVDNKGFGTLFNCLPVCDHGALIITSRYKTAARMLVEDRDVIEVPQMDEEEAVALLKQKLGGKETTVQLGELASALEFMPLAITQAAAYLKRRGHRFSIEAYLKELQRVDGCNQGLLDHNNGDLRRDRDATNSILLTWQISFEYISRERKTAADLLSLMSLCDRQAIPELLITQQDMTQSASDYEFEDDLEVLINFSFITSSAAGSAFKMHRLVQLANRKWLLSHDLLGTHLETLITRIYRLFPWQPLDNMSMGETLYPHARCLLELEQHVGTNLLLQWATVMELAAEYASFKGSRVLCHQAIEMGKRSWEVRRRQLGEEHPDTLMSTNNLSKRYYRLGNSKLAAEIGEQCWEARKKQLGQEDPATLTSMASLAIYYNELGDSKKAAEIGEECLEARKKRLGNGHPDTLRSMANMTTFYIFLGYSKRAVSLGEQCWEGRKKELGLQHLDTVRIMAGLATAYLQLGDIKKGAEMSVQGWEALRQQLGDEHPETLNSMSNLFFIYWTQGKRNKAEKIEKQCWEAKKRQLGEEHPSTLVSMSNLALIYCGQERWTEAEKVEKQCWEAKKRQLGEEHPSTLVSMSNLASIYHGQGRWKEAEEVEKQCCEAKRRRLGEEHPSTLVSMSNLASIYRDQGRLGGAEQLQVKALDTSRVSSGLDLSVSLSCMTSLAVT